MKTPLSVLVLGASAAALAIAAGGISDAELAALDRACVVPVRVEYKDGWLGVTRVATCDRMRRSPEALAANAAYQAAIEAAKAKPAPTSGDLETYDWRAERQGAEKFTISPEPFDWRAAQNAGR